MRDYLLNLEEGQHLENILVTICLYWGSFERHSIVESCVFVVSGTAKGSMMLARWLGEVIRSPRNCKFCLSEGDPILDYFLFNSSISEDGEGEIDVPEHSF